MRRVRARPLSFFVRSCSEDEMYSTHHSCMLELGAKRAPDLINIPQLTFVTPIDCYRLLSTAIDRHRLPIPVTPFTTADDVDPAYLFRSTPFYL